jgi:hypothetical protein
MVMYREWKEIELCWFGDVQRMEGIELCWFGDVQRMEGNRISKIVHMITIT